PGDHATTFGGQPLAAAAARAVLEVMEREEVPERAARAGARLGDALLRIPGVEEVRGLGLLLAAQLDASLDARLVASACLDAGLAVAAVTPTALRLSPSLLVPDTVIDEAIHILATALAAAVARPVEARPCPATCWWSTTRRPPR